MTGIYNSFQTDGGSSHVQSTYANLSRQDVTGKRLLARLLFSEGDLLARTISRIVTTSVQIPEAEINITVASQAPKALGQVLAAYLESFMTNFTLGGFGGCAKHGMLIRNQSYRG